MCLKREKNVIIFTINTIKKEKLFIKNKIK